ncbi:tetratricopeptide repeat protein [Litoreibacter janthinus]|uniref:TPR repeat-containing protein n=1 Tax=Litoreibacter janthinus TaxID=670154 RepID=A0A1I6HT02_9RHOB|nr:tetratricopeptide repeat protein [Litoreibacter janthinus]SFR57592.1 TPR repeat-containing protein [Litoreibacter janthinus]
MRNWVGILTIGLTLAGCAEKAPSLGEGADPFPPSGDVTRFQSVDGLSVGHRLMEAGQFELALKAYLRAAGEQGTNVDVLSALGSANLRLGRLGQSEKLLRQAIKVDQTFVPAWNNLGVVLMETGRAGEASRVFKTAFALDSGKSDEIRENLRRALAKIENPAYSSEKDERAFDLVRRGNGRYLILKAP